jgi:hypothetical protein
MLHMLSLNDFPMMNLCDVKDKCKRNITSNNETSSKLWHCHLGHISKGRMERLTIEEILTLLDFSDLDHYVDCIKGKYVKHIKKGEVTRNSCGPFNVKLVDGLNSFITFTNDFSLNGYIYPMREQSKALDPFKLLKAKVENWDNVKIKVMHSDQGQEYYRRHTTYGKFLIHLLNSSKKIT